MCNKNIQTMNTNIIRKLIKTIDNDRLDLSYNSKILIISCNSISISITNPYSYILIFQQKDKKYRCKLY